MTERSENPLKNLQLLKKEQKARAEAVRSPQQPHLPEVPPLLHLELPPLPEEQPHPQVEHLHQVGLLVILLSRQLLKSALPSNNALPKEIPPCVFNRCWVPCRR